MSNDAYLNIYFGLRGRDNVPVPHDVLFHTLLSFYAPLVTIVFLFTVHYSFCIFTTHLILHYSFYLSINIHEYNIMDVATGNTMLLNF